MTSYTYSFPHLGWEFSFSPDLVNFELFGIPFSIKWYGVLIAIGFLLAMIYALKRAKYFGIDPDRMIDVTLVSALFAFIGARLYYVVFSSDLDAYLADPKSILEVWNGGLAIYGGIIFAFCTALWMCRVRKVNTLAMFDLASLSFLIGQGIGRWGNFVNQEAFGCNTTLPWGMTGSHIQETLRQSQYTLQQAGITVDPTAPVHPTFLYESLWCLLGLIVLHLVSKKMYRFKGQIFALYIMWYGAGRFMIEGLRTDSLYFGTMRVSQLVAALSVIGGLILLFVFKNYADRSPKTLIAADSILGGDAPTDEEAASDENADEVAEDETAEAAEETPAVEETATDTDAAEAEQEPPAEETDEEPKE